MQKAKLPSLITILILTLVTAVAWIGFSIYRTFTQVSPPSVPQDISQPLTPSLDTDTINKINSALFFSSSEIPAVSTATPTSSPTPVPTLAPTATPAASPTETPTSSPTETPSPTP